MAEETEVNTVFTVSHEQADSSMSKMSDAAKRLDQTMQAARQQTEKLKLPGAPMPEGGKGVKEAAGGEGPSSAEQEMFRLDKEEMMLKRKRIRHEKLEIGKEHAVTRIGEAALMAVVGAENALAKAVSKSGAMMQGLGVPLAGLGGTLGAAGGALTKMGGYAAIAGLAIEAGTSALELFGVDVEHVGEKIKEWASGVEHLKLNSKYLGFQSEADMKAAEATKKRWNAESLYASVLHNQSELFKSGNVGVGASFTERNTATEELHENMIDLTKKVRASGGALPDEDFAGTLTRVTSAFEASATGWQRRVQREAELEKLEENASKLIAAIPYKADAEAMAAHYEMVMKSVDDMARHHTIDESERGAVAAGLEAQVEKRGALQNELDQMRESSVQQSLMDEAIKRMMKEYKVINPKATADAHIKLNTVFLKLAKKYGEMYGFDTGALASQFINKAEDAAMAKTHKVFDFRGSHFDIKQAFSDIDPERIAAAFSNDLASQGERRVMSQFSPPWTG